MNQVEAREGITGQERCIHGYVTRLIRRPQLAPKVLKAGRRHPKRSAVHVCFACDLECMNKPPVPKVVDICEAVLAEVEINAVAVHPTQPQSP